MPCDFSGEILIENGVYDLAEKLDKQLIVTSFNGDYIGYITEDHHYDISKRSEIREMNWVGPHYGAYFKEILRELVQK
jgi:neutral ceramidase